MEDLLLELTPEDYLNSEAEMIISILEPGAEVHFRLLGPKTIIFSPELHFYDEVFVHLTMRENFERYLRDNSGLLKEAGERRQDFKDKQDNF